MKLEPTPVYRKIIIPWHDSEAACLVVIVFLFFVVLFGFVGIKVGSEIPMYQSYLWVPVLLVGLSTVVIISITIRLIRRFLRRFPG
jgi:uncharacterized protein (DUF983 family)